MIHACKSRHIIFFLLNEENHRAIPKKSEVATTTGSVARKDIFFGTTTRSIATRPRTTIIVTFVYLQRGRRGWREMSRREGGRERGDAVREK